MLCHPHLCGTDCPVWAHFKASGEQDLDGFDDHKGNDENEDDEPQPGDVGTPHRQIGNYWPRRQNEAVGNTGARCRIPYSLRCQSVGHQNISITISGMLYCILSGQEDSGGEVVVPWRESLRGFSHPAVHGRR